MNNPTATPLTADELWTLIELVDSAADDCDENVEDDFAVLEQKLRDMLKQAYL